MWYKEALIDGGFWCGQGPNDKDTKKKFKQKPSNEEEYELSRYKPVLRSVIEVRWSALLTPYPRRSSLRRGTYA